MEEVVRLTPQLVQQDLDALGQYKTADVDKLVHRYVRQKADASALREHILYQQQFHRIYYYVSLDQIKDVNARMEFIHENLLFTDWWHADQLIRYVAKLDFETAMDYTREYIRSEDPFVRRWGYVMFISSLGRNHADRLLPLMKNDDHYYVQMAEAWLIAELAISEPEAVYQWMTNCGLSYSICGKAIQKICDSYRISQEWKECFKALRPELKREK
jgi:3-methyladenine DNA glycosylase AlkD